MVYQKWNIKRPEPQKIKQLSALINAPRLLCGVLVSRGIDTKQKVEQMLGGMELPSPMSICDMQRLVTRVHAAVENGEKIVVFGDYDVDGITATALMVTYLESIGGEVYFKLPSRSDDGYGLSISTIDTLAKKGINLIVTVDNGISAREEIEYANKLGIDVVVTDHHLPPEHLPNASAVVDPLRLDDLSEYKSLSGVGVAFMAACAIEGCSPEELLEYYADLVAIGTIADIMNITGINRTLVRAGVEQLQCSDRAGIMALIKKCGLEGKVITAENIAFALSPRLNAAGRMDDASLSLSLILEEDPDIAAEMADKIEEYNVLRQATEQAIAKELIQKVNQDAALAHSPVLVVYGKNYHPGVIGIVASRLMEHFNKPTIVLSIDENGEAKGSGRSFAGFSLYNAIASCADILERFGGHDLAAGLSIKKENLELFKQRINEYAAKNFAGISCPECEIDLPVKIQELTVAELEAINNLAPFGQGNPAPLFVVENAVIDAVYPLSEGKHTRIKLVQGTDTLYAVMFGVAPTSIAYQKGDKVDVVVSLSVYAGQNGKMLSGKVRAIRPAGMDNKYVDYTELYTSYCSGINISQQKIASLCPQREDVINMYRIIGRQVVHSDDLRPVFFALGCEKTGKLLAAVDVLKELGHIEELHTDGAAILVQSTDKTKKPLENSQILSQLELKA